MNLVCEACSPAGKKSQENYCMKVGYRVVPLLRIHILWLGCAGTQNQQVNTERWNNGCPEWQSLANCAHNH
jgi:hypothetical protein